MSNQNFEALCDVFYGDTVQDFITIWQNESSNRERLVRNLYPDPKDPARQIFRRAMRWVADKSNDQWFWMLKPEGTKIDINHILCPTTVSS